MGKPIRTMDVLLTVCRVRIKTTQLAWNYGVSSMRSTVEYITFTETNGGNSCLTVIN